ncbi:hypothetical protein BDZ89DRAFT_1158687 [Hymenopellis radicata]|nr:hypothetical protein BDZ89DRAFT_1158687 [Hymenopellis radicata]
MSSNAEQLGFSTQQVKHAGYLNQHILAVLPYGLYTTIFFMTVTKIAARHEWPRKRVSMTILVCVIWALATVQVGLYWSGLYSAFVTNGQSQDAIIGYMWGLGGSLTSQRLARNILCKTVVAVNVLMAELINIWRCWEVYHRNWLVIVVPLLGILCGLISHAFIMVAWFRPTGITVNVSILQANWTIVYYSVTASISILTTILIIGRIVSQTGGLKRARTYRGVIEILVESAVFL